jgi:hypothetical protein
MRDPAGYADERRRDGDCRAARRVCMLTVGAAAETLGVAP